MKFVQFTCMLSQVFFQYARWQADSVHTEIRLVQLDRSFPVRVVSFLSSVAFLVPAAFALTFFIYKCVAATFRALRWIVALLKIMFRRIKQEATSVCMWISKFINQLCFWQNTTTNTNSLSTVEGSSQNTKGKFNSSEESYRARGLG